MRHNPLLPTTAALLFATLALSACNTPPANHGSSGGRIDPAHDAPSETGSTSLRSADLVVATDNMTRDLANRLDVVNAKSPPRIVVGNIEDKTTSRTLNSQVFINRLRAELNQTSARNGLQFVRERSYVESQRDREYGTKDAASTASAYKSTADYILTCEIFDLPSAGTNYYLLDYQLVQLRDAASGPNVGAGAIVWENSYEVKYQ